MLNIALIGCGRIGKVHAAVVRASTGARLAAVHDVDIEQARSLAEVNEAKAFASPEEIFADRGIDAVIVASVTSTHADYIEAAVAAGKPVLCEKPIDLDMDRVLACRDRIAGKDVPVQIGFNRRFDPGHRALRDAFVAGEAGDLLQLVITSRDPAPPVRGYVQGAGGMIRDMTVHDFDLARFILCDDEPVAVFATGAALIEPDLYEIGEIDCATFVMQTAHGRQITISNSRQASYGYDQRVELLGTKAMLQSTNRTPHGLERFNASGVAKAEPYLNFFTERYRDAFALQFDSFVEVARGKAAASPAFDDGMKALALAEAAYRSLQSRALVPVDK